MTNKDVTTKTCETTCCEASNWRSFFTAPQWVLYSVIMLIGLILRWTLLDGRPYHHDESLHGMYGRYFYDFPDSNYYKYDPMLHGPMLYNSMRFIYAWFGDSLWAARTPTCIMGSIFMLMPFLFRRYFKQSSVLILTAVVAFSPTLAYWARFLREDSWVMAGLLFTLYGFTAAPRSWKAFFVIFGFTVQWCTKESAIVSLAVLLGYLVFEAFFKIFILKEWDTLFERIGKHITAHRWQVVWSILVCFGVYAWFYSAGFRYPDGIINGLGKKAFDYWSKHHAMERIQGPFNFHIYVMSWYELPVFIAFLTHIVLFYRRASSEVQFVGFCVAALIMLSCINTDPNTIRDNAMWKPFKLKDNLDIVGLLVLLCHAPIVTVQHLLRRQYVLAATGYFATATFFVYSYLGEKVPWLSVYPLIFLLPYLTLFFEDYFKRYPIDYKNYSVKSAALYFGCVLSGLAFWFIVEESKLSGLQYYFFFANLFLAFTVLWDFKTKESKQTLLMLGLALWVGGIAYCFWNGAFNAGYKPNEDIVLASAGALFILVGIFDKWGHYLGTFNVGRWLTVGVLLFMIRASVQTNFLYGGRETEYLSQVHTTHDLHEVALQIIDDVTNQRHGYKPLVYATGEATWPLAWYFRHLKDEYKFIAKPEERSNYTYLFIDWKDQREPGDIPEGYTARKLNLRGWWVPEFKQMTLKKFLRYSFNHYPWSPSGFTYTTFLMAKDRSRFKQ